MAGADDIFKKNEPLARFTTFKIGGPADYFYDAKTLDELVEAVEKGRQMNLPITILAGGSNVLISDKGIRGLVIRNNARKISIKGAKGKREREIVYVEAESGVSMNQLVRFTIEEGLAGLEMQLGLPGSVGGAIYMNSKWTHPEGYVGDPVYQAEILTPQNERKKVPKSYFEFAYDSSRIQKSGDIVLSVLFALKVDSRERLWNIATESVKYRQLTQPQGVHSPGCTFRNITKGEALSIPTPNHTTSAGFLVDHAGCKGMRVGDAEVSPMHANFIINRGKATAKDVLELIEKIRTKVKEKFGVTLKEEIVTLGEF